MVAAGGNILSQDEIDALLSEADDVGGGGGGASGGGGGSFSDADLKSLEQFYSKAVDSISTVLSTISNQKVDISTPEVKLVNTADALGQIPGSKVVVNAPYQEGVTGSFFLYMNEEAAGVLASLMMGEEGRQPEELTELYISGIVEAMNQMLGSMTTNMSSQLKGITVVNGMPEVKVTDLADTGAYANLQEAEQVVVNYRISIGDLASGDFVQLDAPALARQLLAGLSSGSAPAAASAPEPVASPAAGAGAGAGVNVRPVQFASFDQQPVQQLPTNLDLLVDVPMRVTVELGRTKMRIREILNLGAGSILELDKLAGEPVDLLVNGKLIAKGEVVVIDENFGVRVTDIVPPAERFNELL